MSKGWTAQLAQELQPHRLLTSLVAGLVTGTIAVTIATASGILLFSGELSTYIPSGIGLMLFGSAIVAGLTALTSSFRGLVAGLQESALAFLVSISASIIHTMPASATSQETFYTVVAAISVSSFLTGVAFLLLGQFKLGNLIRYIPYPVIGGFLAGSGLLLALYALSLMAGVEVNLFQLAALAHPGLWLKWLPGVVFALLMLVVLRQYDHVMIVPGMLLAATLVFYVCLWLTHTPIATATAQGWLISLPGGRGGLWQPRNPANLSLVHWSVLGQQMGGLVVIAVVSAISILLNATGIEMATGEDLDLNRELRAVGISSLVAGLGGGPVGSHVLSDSVLAHRMGAKSRLVGIVLAAVCIAVLLAGAALLSYFPTFLLGGLLLFLGLDFLVEWLYDAWFSLPKADYFIVLLILVVINALGFLQGVGVGVVVAVILFVVNYSRINIVKHALSGAHYHSNVERPRLYQQLLRQKGQWLYILELQGFIFFGTANTLLERVRQRVNTPHVPKIRFVVLDFRLVRGLDSSAVLSFAKMKQLAQRQGFTLIFTHLSNQSARHLQMAHQLRDVVQDAPLSEAQEVPVVRTFPDLDHGVEWCEEQMLQTFASVGLAAKPKTLKQELERVLPASSASTHLLQQLDQGNTPSRAVANLWEHLDPKDEVHRNARAEPYTHTDLMAYLEREAVEAGHYLIRQGETFKALYFIERGQVTVQLEGQENGHQSVRLRTMGAGTVVGDMGLYLGGCASASVITEQPTLVYRLSAENLKQMEETTPKIALAFHKFIAGLLSERLANANDTLQALLS